MSAKRRRLFNRPPDQGRIEREVDDEIRFHIERRAERLAQEGMGRLEARREAERRFGDMKRVRSRMFHERRAHLFLISFLDRLADVRFAIRHLRRDAGSTVVAVLTLALGIGSTTAVFSVVDGVLLRPLPFPEPENLTVVWADWSQRGGPANEWMNFPDYHDLKERSRSLAAVAAWDEGPLTLTGQFDPRQMNAGFVSHDMFSDVLRVSPALGRGFLPENDRPGAQGVIILSDGFWQRELGADPTVVGSTLILDDEPYSIVGVMGSDFDPPIATAAEIWIPLRQDVLSNTCGRGGACLRALARLATNGSWEQAREEAREIAAQLEVEYPETNLNSAFTLLPLHSDMVADTRTGLLLMFAAVGVVLLIACVNVANLLMARATGRAPEFGIRSALGAGRGRLTAQLLTESTVLALLGGILGLGLALVGTEALLSLAPDGTPRIETIRVDARVLAFGVIATVAAGLGFGVVPSLRIASRGLPSALREAGRSGSREIGGLRARGVLVSAQVALALVLLVGAGLLVRSFQNLRSRDLGFQPQGVLTVQLGLRASRYPDPQSLRLFDQRLEDRLAALPGVSAVGTTSWLPLTGFGSDTDFSIEGQSPPPLGQNQAVWFRRVSAGYLDAMRLELVSGRWIAAGDDAAAPRVVVINDGLARRFFPSSDPLGQRINLGNPDQPTWREVVGVVREAAYFGLRDGSRDALYLPYAQAPSRTVFVTLRSAREFPGLASEVQGAVSELDPSLAPSRVLPMSAVVSEALGPERFVSILLIFFSGAAVLLAMIGLYGVVSYSVGLRMREMGVRMALGAETWEIRQLVLKSAARPVAAGIVIGIPGGFVLAQLMSSLLFGIGAVDPWTYLGMTTGLIVVAALASIIPAERAARIDPVQVMSPV